MSPWQARYKMCYLKGWQISWIKFFVDRSADGPFNREHWRTCDAFWMLTFYILPAKMDVQPPPLRTLDDFVLSSARFSFPDVRNLERWNNRIINNLLYYQTNYFVSFLGFLVLIGWGNHDVLAFNILASESYAMLWVMIRGGYCFTLMIFICVRK